MDDDAEMDKTIVLFRFLEACPVYSVLAECPGVSHFSFTRS